MFLIIVCKLVLVMYINKNNPVHLTLNNKPINHITISNTITFIVHFWELLIFPHKSIFDKYKIQQVTYGIPAFYLLIKVSVTH